MSTVKIDKITMLEAQERYGALQRLVRIAEVSGIASTSWQTLTQALGDANVPSYGDHLSDSPESSAYELTLVERRATVIDKDRVQVELIYENCGNIEQDLDDPRPPYVVGEVRCNIQQKTSDKDINGDQVTVQHVYPEDDPNHPGETLVQGGEFQYNEPQRTINVRGMKQTNTPWLVANNIVGRVNDRPWSGESARIWLCTGCSWKLAHWRSGSSKFFMDFEFQQNPDTWDPTVRFIDDVTNKPPANLVEGVGYKVVEKMPECDFENLIGAPLLGG